MSFLSLRWAQPRVTTVLLPSGPAGFWLYTTRGVVDGYFSSMVEVFDTCLYLNQWLDDLGEESEYDFQWMDARMPHFGVFEGEEGIYVAGGNGETTSAEFYNLASDSWQQIGSLITGHSYSPMTMLGENLIMSGGLSLAVDDMHLTSVETWNRGRWDELNNLRAYQYHAAVTIN